MDDPNSKPEKPKAERRYDPELLKKGLRCDLDQYEMLKRCSDKKDITEWNKWIHEHELEEVFLEGADLFQSYLKGVLLWGAHLEGAKLGVSNMEGANLSWAHMENVDLIGTRLIDAKLMNTHLDVSRLGKANLEKATIMWAHLQGSEFYESNLCGAKLHRSCVNSETSFWHCEVDEDTDLRGVALSEAQVDPATKQLLEYNIRRKNWEDWYKKHYLLKWLVKSFWWISDYGISTKRIICTSFGLAFIFALLYRLFPSFVMVYDQVGDIRGFWHALYFSVVTMTTLGFGDIAANPDSWVGQTLLMIQVILGYVLLGALVTRFAVLFTAGGPAGKFADEKEKEDEKK
jgi:uncharacterized protein YjbI with pentapeptide repeats